MSDIHHEDFVELLNIIKDKLSHIIEFDKERTIESNFDTKGLIYKNKRSLLSDGTIIVGEDEGLISVDISKADGEIVSFLLKNIEDSEGIEKITNWMIENYK